MLSTDGYSQYTLGFDMVFSGSDLTDQCEWGGDMPIPEQVTVELSRQQALVLWSFLNRCDEEESYSFKDQAEQRVLWDLEILLQPQLPEITSPGYAKCLEEARDQLRDRD